MCFLCWSSGSSQEQAASFRNIPPPLEGDTEFNLDDFSSFDKFETEDPQAESRLKRSDVSEAYAEDVFGGIFQFFKNFVTHFAICLKLVI